MRKYEILERDRFSYVGLVLLNEIINFQTTFPVKPLRDQIFLQAYFEHLVSINCLAKRDGKYIPTEVGRNKLVAFYAKYSEYVKFYDVFCAVDLESGEFAFSQIDAIESDDAWFDFLNEERFSDVRVAVCEFKGIDPKEVVFMSFLNEGRFSTEDIKWEYNLTGASVWGEIEEICNTAVSKDYLMEDGVLEDVIRQGTDLALDLIKMAEEVQDLNGPSSVDDEGVEYIVETVEITEHYDDDYWDPYYNDPFYVSPIWLVPIILW